MGEHVVGVETSARRPVGASRSASSAPKNSRASGCRAPRATAATFRAGSMPSTGTPRSRSASAGSRRCWRSRPRGWPGRAALGDECARRARRVGDHRVREGREVEVVAEQRSGGTVSVIWTRVHAGRRRGPAGSVGSGCRGVPARASALASGVAPSESTGRARRRRTSGRPGGRRSPSSPGSRGTRRRSAAGPPRARTAASSRAARAPSPRRGTGRGSRAVASPRTSGSSRRPISAEDPLDDLEHRHCGLVGEVERLAAHVGDSRPALGQQHVGGGAVLDVEVVADVACRRSG